MSASNAHNTTSGFLTTHRYTPQLTHSRKKGPDDTIDSTTVCFWGWGTVISTSTSGTGGCDCPTLHVQSRPRVTKRTRSPMLRPPSFRLSQLSSKKHFRSGQGPSLHPSDPFLPRSFHGASPSASFLRVSPICSFPCDEPAASHLSILLGCGTQRTIGPPGSIQLPRPVPDPSQDPRKTPRPHFQGE
jgi:hypothetical protein